MTTKIELWSMASILLGNGVQQSGSADNPFIKAATSYYPHLKHALLVGHRWGFAQKKQALSKLTETPLNTWQVAYQVPPEALAVYAVYPHVDYEIFGDKIFANHDSLECDFLQDVTEGKMPEYFVQALATRLASHLAYQITKDATLTKTLSSQAMADLRQARAIDVQQRPTQEVMDKPFIVARYA